MDNLLFDSSQITAWPCLVYGRSTAEGWGWGLLSPYVTNSGNYIVYSSGSSSISQLVSGISVAVIATIVLSISYQAFAKFRKLLSRWFLKQLAKSWKNVIGQYFSTSSIFAIEIIERTYKKNRWESDWPPAQWGRTFASLPLANFVKKGYIASYWG